MSRTTSAVAVSTIGIDPGKNTLHLIGLDEQGTIVGQDSSEITQWERRTPTSREAIGQ